ncbi:MAG: DNA-binding domain-containing protein [Zavarzinia sp.]|nr:DNA-binding domain-containing protein [Zavarzinia sp.]
MSALTQLQRTIADDLLGRAPGRIEALIGDAPHADRTTLAGVYRHAYGARLVEVLEAEFPGTRGLMGADAFAKAARAYVGRHPSTEPSVRWLGRLLAGDLAAAGDTVAADMAAFEWALGLAFDAAPGEKVEVGALAALSGEEWEGLRVDFQPGLSVLTLHHPVHELWPLAKAGESLAPPARLAAPLALAVWRLGLEPQYRPLQPGEDDLLARLRDGSRFGEALGDADPARALTWFAGWCMTEMVSAIRF